MEKTLKDDLLSLTCEGNKAYLPTEMLNDYAALKKSLIKICGVYKKNSFEFPYPANEVIGKLINGENTDFKKEFQFFATPPELANRMCNEIIGFQDAINVLEPSAGHGALIDAVLKVRPYACIHAVELSDLNFKVLQEKYLDMQKSRVRLFKGDFLLKELDGPYNLIIANPPFTKNQDIDHIYKMYDLLAEGGQIITIASKSWTFGSQKKQTDFKGWLENKVCANWVDLEHGSFKSSGTNISGVLITISK